MTPAETRFFHAWNQLPAPYTLPEEIDPAFKDTLMSQFKKGRFLSYYSTVLQTGLRGKALSHFITANPHGTYLWVVARGDALKLKKIMEDDSIRLTQRVGRALQMTDHVAVRQVAGYYDADCIFRDYEHIVESRKPVFNPTDDYILVCFGLGVKHVNDNIPPHVIEACSTKYYKEYTVEQKKAVVEKIMHPLKS